MYQFYQGFLDWLTIYKISTENKEKILKVCFRLSNDPHVMYFRPVLVNDMKPLPLKGDLFNKNVQDRKKRGFPNLFFQLFQKSYVLRNLIFLENFTYFFSLK